MKKILAMLLLACMVLSLAACGQQAAPAPAAEQPAAEEPAAEEAAPAEEPAAEEPAAEEPAAAAEYELGMGVVVKTDSSKAGNAQVDATVAAVVTDAEGKIVAVKLDVAQNKMDITDGQVETEKEFKTKLELGDDYNMVKYGGSTYEWYQQAAAFEEYALGKTADEIAATETKEDGEHVVFVDEALYASCSISVKDFIDAIVKACNDDQAQTFTAGEFKLGLAAITEVDPSTKAATAEEDGLSAMYTNFAAAVVDAEGKIVASIIDEIQPKISFDAAGEITGATFNGTKRELKEDYKMKAIMNTTYEWYEQAQHFVDYAAGKTADELKATETVVNEEGHHVFADETLLASVSISIDGMIDVLVKAVGNAA